MDLLDTAFYWLDGLAFLVFPPLLLHFFIIFPRRKKIFRRRPSSIYILYGPAGVLFLAKIFIHLPNIWGLSDDFIVRYYEASQKLDLLHFGVFSLVAFGVILFDTLKTSQVIVKRQLKWIVYGLGLGLLPFTLFYIGPFLLDQVPHRVAEFSVILQALVPLTFAYSISRYRLLDIELILRKAVPLIFSYMVIALLYFIVSSQTSIFPENQFNVLVLGVLAIILGATLYTPIKKVLFTGI